MAKTIGYKKTPENRGFNGDLRTVWERSISKVGSPGRTRTSDMVVNSHPLYQLSYRGIGEAPLCGASSSTGIQTGCRLLLISPPKVCRVCVVRWRGL